MTIAIADKLYGRRAAKVGTKRTVTIEHGSQRTYRETSSLAVIEKWFGTVHRAPAKMCHPEVSAKKQSVLWT